MNTKEKELYKKIDARFPKAYRDEIFNFCKEEIHNVKKEVIETAVKYTSGHNNKKIGTRIVIDFEMFINSLTDKGENV